MNNLIMTSTGQCSETISTKSVAVGSKSSNTDIEALAAPAEKPTFIIITITTMSSHLPTTVRLQLDQEEPWRSAMPSTEKSFEACAAAADPAGDCTGLSSATWWRPIHEYVYI
jgi:hypothetical protein